jgi:hypothetical protein
MVAVHDVVAEGEVEERVDRAGGLEAEARPPSRLEAVEEFVVGEEETRRSDAATERRRGGGRGSSAGGSL